MNFIYSDDPRADYINILSFLDGFVEDYNLTPFPVNVYAVERVIKEIRLIPCRNGLDGASVFKKAATFVLCFVDARPIVNPLPKKLFPEDLLNINNHQNGALALMMAFRGMHKSSIKLRDGKTVVLKNPIELSSHSFIDLVDAVSNTSLVVSFKMLTLLLEQLAYKTNPDCQYPAGTL